MTDQSWRPEMTDQSWRLEMTDRRWRPDMTDWRWRTDITESLSTVSGGTLPSFVLTALLYIERSCASIIL